MQLSSPCELPGEENVIPGILKGKPGLYTSKDEEQKRKKKDSLICMLLVVFPYKACQKFFLKVMIKRK